MCPVCDTKRCRKIWKDKPEVVICSKCRAIYQPGCEWFIEADDESCYLNRLGHESIRLSIPKEE